MEYRNLVPDFAARTLKNLEAIERMIEHNPEAEVFEVTQLINSMLGLLVFPQQSYCNKIERIPIEQLREEGWPIPPMANSPCVVSDLRDLVRCLRNGISHCNIELIADGHELTGIKIWNCVGQPARKNWQIILDLEDLKTFVRKFLTVLEGLE
jgi:hypothetical protein